MEQFEKVCKGLECCVLRDPDDHRRCGECPYNPHAISNEPCANGLMFNALALIRQQQERIAELEAAQQWISVKDRLPENSNEVLTYGNGLIRVMCLLDRGSGDGDDLLWEDDYGIYEELDNVTHWMPTPEPPKDGSTDENHA